MTPDEYRVSKVTREVLRPARRTEGDRVRPDPKGSGAVRDPGRRRAPERSLPRRGGLADLVDVARRVESHFGGHQDIEWAISRKGVEPGGLFLLQARPVTATGSKPQPQPKSGSAIDLVMGTFGAAGGGDRS